MADMMAQIEMLFAVAVPQLRQVHALDIFPCHYRSHLCFSTVLSQNHPFYNPYEINRSVVFTKTLHLISLLLQPLSASALQTALVLMAQRKEPFKKIK